MRAGCKAIATVNETGWHRLWPLADLAAGQMRCIAIDGRELLVCHTRLGLYAVDNVCSHAETRLSEGRLRGTRLVCPLHGASFDVRSGAALAAPATRPLATHAVRVVDGIIEIRAGAAA